MSGLKCDVRGGCVFRVAGEFYILGFWFRDLGSASRVSGSRLDFGIRVSGFAFRVSGSVFGVLGIRDSDSTFGDSDSRVAGLSGSKVGSYSWLMDCVYHSTLISRLIKKKELRGAAPKVTPGGMLMVF